MKIHASVTFTACALAATALAQSGAEEQVVLMVGGDVQWSIGAGTPDAYYDNPEPDEGDWRPIPYLNNPEGRAYLTQVLGLELETPRSRTVQPHSIPLEFDSIQEHVRFPFQRIAPTLRKADITYVNLENPLSSRGRRQGAFRAPPELAEALRWAGIDIVSIANNHMLDAGEQGLFDTMESLWRAGVGFVGAGRDLEDARRPFIVTRNGIKIAFLGYAHFVNELGPAGFARPDRSGLAPMDPFVVKQDIRRVRDQADYVAVAFHWGMSDKFEVYPENREWAHAVVDAGADLVLGGHPPNPVGIEVYEGKVIIYSAGHLIFGYNRTFWKDDHLVRITLSRERVTRLEVLPIAGEGNDLAQPYLLTGDPARRLLEFLQSRMATLGTRLDIEGDIGVVTP